jgi:hypothetical protein
MWSPNPCEYQREKAVCVSRPMSRWGCGQLGAPLPWTAMKAKLHGPTTAERAKTDFNTSK